MSALNVVELFFAEKVLVKGGADTVFLISSSTVGTIENSTGPGTSFGETANVMHPRPFPRGSESIFMLADSTADSVKTIVVVIELVVESVTTILSSVAYSAAAYFQ